MPKINAPWYRTEITRGIDRCLILYCFQDLRRVDELAYQKILFLVEYYLLRQCRAMPLKLKYFMYTYGPFSKDAYTERDKLRSCGLMNPNRYQVTQAGKDLAEYFAAAVSDVATNQPLLSLIDEIVSRAKKYSGSELMKIVYRLPTLEDPSAKIRDYPKHHDIITPDESLRGLTVPTYFLEDLKEALGEPEVFDTDAVLREADARLANAVEQS